MKKKTDTPFFIYIMLFSLATASAVLYTPALPGLARYFGLSASDAQWTMTLYLLGFSFGHLIYGPLANAYGRRRSLNFGLILAFLGTLICFFTDNFVFFCIGRLIQALGSAAGLKIVFTIMGDLYSKDRAIKVISYLMIGLALAQGAGPTIGGFLTVHYGWKGCFGFLLFYTALLFFLSLSLPETAKELDKGALKPKKIVSGYGAQFKDSFTMLHSIIMGLSTAILYIFSTEAPFIGIDTLKMTPDEYGLFTLFIAFGMLTASFIGNRMIGKVPPRIAIVSSILLTFIGSIVLALFAANEFLNGWILFITFFFIEIGMLNSWIFASAKGISESTNKSNASAVMQFVNMGITTAATLLVGALLPKTALTLSFVFGGLAVLQFIVWIQLREHHLRSPH